MDKKILYIVASVTIAVVLISGIYKMTGFVGGPVIGKCVDSDGGKNLFEKGVTKYENRNTGYEDYCKNENPGSVREYYCLLGDMTIKVKTYRCLGECKDGACVR